MGKKAFAFSMLTLVSILVVACQTTAPSPTPIVQTVVVPVTVEEADTLITQIVPPTPIPSPSRTLTICAAQEPANLFLYGEDEGKSKNNILEALYDGPIDHISYRYQPVILENLPSLANGGARIQAITVNPGDPIIDNNGQIVTLAAGVQYRPAGCTEAGCSVTYTGNQTRVTMDQLQVTFKLRSGLLWADGIPIKAADSVYSFNLAKNPELPTDKTILDRTAAYEALDENTVKWAGLPGYRAASYPAHFWSPLPEHLWKNFSAADLLNAKGDTLIPIGWGPYTIEEWIPGTYIRLSKNPNYFRAGEGLPKFDQLFYRFVGSDPAKTIPMLLAGECDILEETPQLFEQGELLLALQKQAQLQAVFGPKTAWEHIDIGIVPFSYDNGWIAADDRPNLFGDARTRQALAMCMDRQTVVETVLFGQSTVLDSYLPPEHPLYNEEVAHYAYDPIAGAALLEEVGWLDEDGDPATPRTYAGRDPEIPRLTRLSFNLWTSNTPHRQQSIQILAQSLAECGIQASVKFWSNEEYFIEGPDGPIFGRRFDLGQFAWLSDTQPLCELYLSDFIPGDPLFINPYSGEPFVSWNFNAPNVSGFSNPDFDATCKAALTFLPGQSGYAENHLRAQEIFAEELPAIPLYLQLKAAATRVDMCNFVMDPTTSSEFFNIEAFDYGEGCEK